MEIIVIGNSKMKVLPDIVSINIVFREKNKTYQDALNLGTNKVYRFINKILLKNNFKEKDLKTNTFRISENKIYNKKLEKYDIDGYVFEQTANLEFKYDKIKLVKIIEEISSIDIFIDYTVNFTISDKQAYRDIMLKKAFSDAYNQALSICEAANKDNIECISCERISGDNLFLSSSYLERQNYKSNTISEVINTSFNPQDILLEESIKCIFTC